MLPNLAGLQLHDAEETAGRPARPLVEKDRNNAPIPPQGKGRAIAKRGLRSHGPAAPAKTVADIREEQRGRMSRYGIGVRLVRSNPDHRASMALYCYTYKFDKILQAPPRGIAPASLLPRTSAIDGNRHYLSYAHYPGFFFFAE